MISRAAASIPPLDESGLVPLGEPGFVRSAIDAGLHFVSSMNPDSSARRSVQDCIRPLGERDASAFVGSTIATGLESPARGMRPAWIRALGDRERREFVDATIAPGLDSSARGMRPAWIRPLGDRERRAFVGSTIATGVESSARGMRPAWSRRLDDRVRPGLVGCLRRPTRGGNCRRRPRSFVARARGRGGGFERSCPPLQVDGTASDGGGANVPWIEPARPAKRPGVRRTRLGVRDVSAHVWGGALAIPALHRTRPDN
jgi:hypothetical protein